MFPDLSFLQANSLVSDIAFDSTVGLGRETICQVTAGDWISPYVLSKSGAEYS